MTIMIERKKGMSLDITGDPSGEDKWDICFPSTSRPPITLLEMGMLGPH